MMNILYIGSSGPLSLIPFKKLLSTRHTITAVGIYNPVTFNGKVIAVENESLALAANQQNLPLLDLSLSIDSLLEQCKKLSIDAILMSCYRYRLPEAIINLADKGCFNCHPSLLPRFRGPEPIFWQLRTASKLGVSWHQVTYEFDAGDIAVQKTLVVDDGESYLDINTQLAELGANCMIDLLSAITSSQLTLTPQNSSQYYQVASYDEYPQPKDFIIDTQWTAQHAYNFMCGTLIFNKIYQCQVGQYTYQLKEAIDFDNNTDLDEAEIQSDRIYIPCKEGVLIARYTDKIVH